MCCVCAVFWAKQPMEIDFERQRFYVGNFPEHQVIRRKRDWEWVIRNENVYFVSSDAELREVQPYNPPLPLLLPPMTLPYL